MRDSVGRTRGLIARVVVLWRTPWLLCERHSTCPPPAPSQTQAQQKCGLSSQTSGTSARSPPEHDYVICSDNKEVVKLFNSPSPSSTKFLHGNRVRGKRRCLQV